SRFCASLTLGAVILTYSQPDSIMRIACSTEPCVSMVSIVVIDCTRIGLSPPKGTPPILTSIVFRLLYRTRSLQYCLTDAMFWFTKKVFNAKLTFIWIQQTSQAKGCFDRIRNFLIISKLVARSEERRVGKECK